LTVSCVRFIRFFLLRHVDAGTQQLTRLQRIRTPLLDKYFTFASLCGSEVFYIIMIPMFFWVFDPVLGRLVVLLLISCLYTGNFLKNLFCLPRPLSPPVWVPTKDSEVLDNTDYGWPSTHSINAVSLPFMLLRYYFGFVWVWEFHSPYYLSMMYILAFLWSGSIIFSRMYIGVHSPADITGGMLIGAFLLRIFLSVGEIIDAWTISSRFVPIYLNLAAYGLLLIHPQTSPASKSFAETSCLIGWATGSMTGSWFRPLDAPITLFPAHLFLSEKSPLIVYIECLWKPCLRVLIGFSLVMLSYTCVKKLLTTVTRSLGIFKERKPEDVRDLTMTECLIKFYSYFVFGFMISGGAPAVFDLLCLW